MSNKQELRNKYQLLCNQMAFLMKYCFCFDEWNRQTICYECSFHRQMGQQLIKWVKLIDNELLDHTKPIFPLRWVSSGSTHLTIESLAPLVQKTIQEKDITFSFLPHEHEKIEDLVVIF